VESQVLLNVMVQPGAAVLKLLTGQDEALLIGRNALLVLNLCFDVVNCIEIFDLKGDCLAHEGLYKENFVGVHKIIFSTCNPHTVAVAAVAVVAVVYIIILSSP